MIKILKPEYELRARDKRRQRLLLVVGKRKFHITRREALYLLKSLRKAVGKYEPICF